jgi:hypothetical protein
MTSGKQSKAQRRVESQQRAAERRAAELRAKRIKTGSRVLAFLVPIAAIVVIVLVVTGGSSTPPPTSKTPKIANTTAIPKTLTTIAAPTQKAGPEVVPIPSGPKLATLATAATGQTVDGIQCQTDEQTVTHVHTHLTIFVNGKAQIIPYGIGIPGFNAVATAEGAFVESGTCFYWLHTHAEDGVIHIESPSTSESFTLGQFFDEWGQTLSSTQVGPAKGKVTAFFDGKLYTGDPRNIPLGYHYQIQLDVGTPIVAPEHITAKQWGQL